MSLCGEIHVWQVASSYFFLQVIAEQKVVGIQREKNEAKKSMNAEIEKLRNEVYKVTESSQVRLTCNLCYSPLPRSLCHFLMIILVMWMCHELLWDHSITCMHRTLSYNYCRKVLSGIQNHSSHLHVPKHN